MQLEKLEALSQRDVTQKSFSCRRLTHSRIGRVRFLNILVISGFIYCFFIYGLPFGASKFYAGLTPFDTDAKFGLMLIGVLTIFTVWCWAMALRLHDMGYSGVMFVFMFLALGLLVLCVWGGTEGDNEYGAPVKVSRKEGLLCALLSVLALLSISYVIYFFQGSFSRMMHFLFRGFIGRR